MQPWTAGFDAFDCRSRVDLVQMDHPMARESKNDGGACGPCLRVTMIDQEV